MSQRGRPRRRRVRLSALLTMLLFAGVVGGGAYAWTHHPEWFAALRPPAPARAHGPTTASPAAPPKAARHATVPATLYYLRETDGEARLVPVARRLPAASPARAALLALLSDEAPAGCRSPLPDKVSLRGVTIREGVAVADFSRELIANFRGGSSNEAAVVYAVVDTLTSLPGVEKAQILVEGRSVDSLGGHLDTSEPLSPNRDMVSRG